VTPRALITGIAGQDGSYLTEFLVGKGYEVFGLLGPDPGDFHERAAALGDAVHGLEGDLTDMASLLAAVEESKPDEVYNLAAMSFVGGSWERAVLTSDVNATGAVRLLEAVRELAPEARLFQASSGEIFGNAPAPQSETTRMHPRSPYGVTKAFGYFMAMNYRESFGMHASNGILFNHESPRRPPIFVTRKITDAAARIKLGMADELRLGNLDAQRDWGFAGDYVEAMWLMLQQDQPGDYVVASGQTHTVRDFCAEAFGRLDLDYTQYVVVDRAFFREAEIDILQGDASKARLELGWEPKVRFEELVAMMVDADMERLSPARSQSGTGACEG
jgi:GDPmannose 4,6-dehydratase